MFGLFKKQNPTSVFVPKGDEFIPYSGTPTTNSINGIGNDLGYQSEQVYCYRDFQNKNPIIEMVAFEFYSKKIIFVFTSKPINNLRKSEVLNYIIRYELPVAFDASEIEHTFDEAVQNKSFTTDFLSDKFGIEFEQNGIHLVPEINYLLFFNDGILCDYQRSDGLNEGANYFKTHVPSRYNLIYNTAKKYWKNDLINLQMEVNIQCGALYNLPDVGNNQFIHLHTNNEGWVNYFMILVTHYSEPLDKNKFIKINHGRYTLINIEANIYKVGKFEYTFDTAGMLSSISSVS